MAHLQQRTAAWHNARRGKLTASNLGAALGLVCVVVANVVISTVVVQQQHNVWLPRCGAGHRRDEQGDRDEN